MAGTANLKQAINPKLSFWVRAGSMYAEYLYVQVSADTGKTWNNVWTWYSYGNPNLPWTREQVNLNPYIGVTNLTVRFLAYNRNGDNYFLDFQVDEVLIDDAPLDVGVTAGPGSDPTHNALLTWAASTAPNFAYYAIYRSTSPNVDPSDILAGVVSNRNTATFQDTNGLDVIGQTYYYRVLVYNTGGLHNWGTNEVSYKTAFGRIATSWPFADGFESGAPNWALDKPWAVTSLLSHSGTYCLASNPGTNYANNADLSAYLSLDLGAATRPLLSFWQRYGFEPNQDYGLVEVSLNQGATWTRLYAVTGQSGANWQNVQVDLAGYAGSQVLIRFRLRSDPQNAFQGWYIDDVAVKDFGLLSLGYPFYDTMDTVASQTNWVGGDWQQIPGSALGDPSGMSYRCLIGNNSYTPGGDLNLSLTLAGTVNLKGAANPKLSFWVRAGSMYAEYLYAQASADGGKTWNTVWSWYSYGIPNLP